MNRQNPSERTRVRYFIPCLSLLLAWSLPAARADDAKNGSIAGQIVNSVTHDTLEGVQVHVVETNQDFISERGGDYKVTGLAPGNYTLIVDYPGLDRQEAKVAVADGQPAHQDFNLSASVYVMPEFTVASEREGNAAAIVQQKRAVNVENVITSDAFGNIAKANVGNFLKRLPGVAGTFDEVDTENIIIRGMSSDNVSLDIDGTRAANANDGRGQNVGAIPTDMIEKVEVIKATTPENDADSLAGRVNLVTKSAFDRKGRLLSVRLGDSYSVTYGDRVVRHGHPLGNALAPSAGVTYADVFSVFGGKNNLGVITNLNYDKVLDVRSTTAWDWTNAAGSTNVLNGAKDYAQFNNTSVALHELVRSAASLRFDYKVNPTTSLTLSGSTNRFDNNMFRNRNRMNTATINTALSDPDPFYTVIQKSAYRALRETRDETTKGDTVRFSAKTKLDTWKISFDTSFDTSNRNQFTTTTDLLSNKQVTYGFDRDQNANFPVISILNDTTFAPTGVNPFGDNFSNAKSQTVQWTKQWNVDDVIGSKVDVEKKFNWQWPITLKTGARYRDEYWRTSRSRIRGSLVGTDLSRFVDSDWARGGALDRFPIGAIPDAAKVQAAANLNFVGGSNPLTAWTYDPTVYTIDKGNTINDSLSARKHVTEDIYGTYIQGEVTFHRLTVLGGVRFERTEDDMSIPFRNRAIVSDPAYPNLAQWSRSSKTRSRNDSFPSVTASYKITNDLILKASYTTAITRPNFGDLLANDDVDVANKTINRANPDLLPKTKSGVDLSLEYYFKPVGVLSVSAFQNKIKNFFVDQDIFIPTAVALDNGAPATAAGDPDYSWEFSQKGNGKSGTIKGLEFNYSQQLSFLPGIWSGLGIYANYTYLKSSGKISNLSDPTSTNIIIDGQLPNYIPHTANAGISYNYGRMDLKLNYNYTGSYLESISFSKPYSQNKWKGDRYQLDFSGKYRVTRNVEAFADLLNLTSTFTKKYRGYIAPVRQAETNLLGFVVTAGVQIDL